MMAVRLSVCRVKILLILKVLLRCNVYGIVKPSPLFGNGGNEHLFHLLPIPLSAFNCTFGVNTVHFLPNLPSGLTNDAAKRAIVNSNEPCEGSAVIMNNGRHVAYCWGVGWYDDDGITRIAIIESNWGWQSNYHSYRHTC